MHPPNFAQCSKRHDNQAETKYIKHETLQLPRRIKKHCMHAQYKAAQIQEVPLYDTAANLPDNPRMKVSSLDHKPIHEENAQQAHHAKSIGYHDVS